MTSIPGHVAFLGEVSQRNSDLTKTYKVEIVSIEVSPDMVSDSIKSSNRMPDSDSLMRCKNPVLVGRRSARRNKGKDSVDVSFAASLLIASR
ncbi:hypothetical protein FVEG_12086 [Fusarium verticillioides 7600]|uniref:Uncharacterized protein n=1 Tax=Gibberella moniliformis (strain M3125 / FGSC 7600) TaxID=334819 RepID=W7MQH5_GIBM7|nr:hypothetical protein FVEG_12086 [Fusarium verticillioides 7600]EWG53713.1 hypothetical protein FVEG_12086 [Fusarium verticillioides 7600]